MKQRFIEKTQEKLDKKRRCGIYTLRQMQALTRKRKRSLLWGLTIATIVMTIVIQPWGTGSHPLMLGQLVGTPPVMAQQVSRNDVWRQVYERLPDFPRENQYIDKETGEIDQDNTLANRLIRYHLFVKRRPPIFRLDWKLTLADYLGANEEMNPNEYPGNELLRQNPLEGDRAAIRQLTRAGREELILVLVTLFDPNYGTNIPQPSPTPDLPPAERPSGPPPLPEPGDADLLKL